MTALLDLKAALSAKNLRFVGQRGTPGRSVCVLGEAPGADEDRIGYPFVGASGQLLDKMLKESGFHVLETWFTNAYKTRPPDNDIKRLHTLV